MEDDDPIVGCKPQVALDACPEINRGREGGQAIFGDGRARMKSAVREPARTRIERVRP